MNESDTTGLCRERTALVVIDVQERLCAAMDPERLAGVRRNTVILLEAAKVLGLAVLVTEQYPKGIGPTLPEIAAALPEGQPLIEKVCFSCVDSDAFMQGLRQSGRDQLLLTGMETHVCVFQTARDLVRAGFTPFVVEDAVISRTVENQAIGLRLMAQAGATRTGTETALFDLLGRAGTPEFKAIAPLIK
jgi:nicotinamidase-related amidase